jgi:hypothetical protein
VSAKTAAAETRKWRSCKKKTAGSMMNRSVAKFSHLALALLSGRTLWSGSAETSSKFISLQAIVVFGKGRAHDSSERYTLP